MNFKNTLLVASSLSLSLVLVITLIVLPAGALSVGTKAAVSASSTIGIKAEVRIATKLNDIITRSNTEIAARIAALNALSVRIESLKNVSVSAKTAVANSVLANTNGLSALKSKIDADTDASVALTDEKTITGSYRIYALVIPQGYILASTDRIAVIAGMMTTLSTQFQARITGAQTVGKNVTDMQALLVDFDAKIADAKMHALAAQTGVAALMPDFGNKTTLEVNTAAIKAARADVKVSSQDLDAARTTAKKIVKEIRSLNVKATSSATITQ
ncbi:MAG: hypothetical protein JWO50_824 [Candidatus Kaiserbacteria bacterium]|nr:hypothetical protein [Candidatus Kaiserbacteria bacterium]